MKYSFYIVLISALLFVSCKKSNPVSAASKNAMTVTIDGTTYNWGGGGVTGPIGGVTVTNLDGTDGSGKNEKLILFDLTNVTDTGTYNISIDSGGNAHTVTMEYDPDTTRAYSSKVGPNPAGKFIITSISNSSITATFNAILRRQKGTTGDSTVTITNGSLNITYL